MNAESGGIPDDIAMILNGGEANKPDANRTGIEKFTW
jgi:hypothetical protein